MRQAPACRAGRRCLAAPFKTPLLLTLLNAIAAVLFIALGIKAYWDHSGWMAFLILALTIAAAWLAAVVLNSRLAKRGGLVEVLEIFANHRLAQQFLRQALGFALKKFAKKIIVLVHALDLLQRRAVGFVFVKNMLNGQRRNTLRNEPSQRGFDGLQFPRIAKARHAHKAVLLECIFVIHGLDFIQSR